MPHTNLTRIRSSVRIACAQHPAGDLVLRVLVRFLTDTLGHNWYCSFQNSFADTCSGSLAPTHDRAALTRPEPPWTIL